jgi:hypothetical protein
VGKESDDEVESSLFSWRVAPGRIAPGGRDFEKPKTPFGRSSLRVCSWVGELSTRLEAEDWVMVWDSGCAAGGA